MFGFAVATGDPYRIIYGYDVAGDICGQKNGGIDIVTYPGKDRSDSQSVVTTLVKGLRLVKGLVQH